MVSKNLNSKKPFQLILPEVYVAGLNKANKTKGLSTLEALIFLSRRLDIVESKEILNSFLVCVLTMLHGAQVKLNAKLIVPKKASSSPEKVFQQTEIHGKMTKILSNSKSAKTIQSLSSISKAIERDLYGITESEATDDGFIYAIKNDFDTLLTTKGAATTKIVVRDEESRLMWLRANISSLRSKWCSIPTYTPNSVASAGFNIKNAKVTDVQKFIDLINTTLVGNEVIKQDERITYDDIINTIHEEMNDLRIDDYIDDEVHGKFNPCELDVIFGYKRVANESIKNRPELPDIAKQLKTIL
jgi:hypothetical protein